MLGSYLKITLIFIKYIDYSLLNYLFGFNLLGFNLFSFNLFRFSLFGFNLFKFNLLRFNLPGFSLRRGISLCRGFSHCWFSRRWFSRRWFSRCNCDQKFSDKLLLDIVDISKGGMLLRAAKCNDFIGNSFFVTHCALCEGIDC